jgi:hypothetical protein
MRKELVTNALNHGRIADALKSLLLVCHKRIEL